MPQYTFCCLNISAFYVQSELLMQAHLTRETAALSPYLQNDFKKMLALAPRLLEELMKVLVVIFV